MGAGTVPRLESNTYGYQLRPVIGRWAYSGFGYFDRSSNLAKIQSPHTSCAEMPTINGQDSRETKVAHMYKMDNEAAKPHADSRYAPLVVDSAVGRNWEEAH